MKNDCELTILMPCLNEELTLATCIRKARKFLVENNVIGEILIADNGSTDRSIEIAKHENARVVQVNEKGYGSALRGGIAAAQGTYIIMGDADDSYNFYRLELFLEELRDGADLVMGNRFKGGIEKGAMPFLHRYLGNPVLSFIGRLFFRIPVGDFHCGLRGFKAERIRSLGLTTTGMEFASEMVVRTALANMEMREVPTTLSPDGRDRPPHLNTWRDGWRHLKFLLVYSPSWSLLYPGLLFFILGLILSITLLPNSINIGSARLDIHTLLIASTLSFIGFQLISIYYFAKEYGIHKGYLKDHKTPKIWDRLFQFDVAFFLGLSLFLGGLGLIGYSFYSWQSVGFTDLDPRQTLRLVIPGIFALIFSVQFVITSFLREMLK